MLDFNHRPGNGHDSKGALEFVLRCVAAVRERTGVSLGEARLDSAHFSDDMVAGLEEAGVEFTIWVAFERFPRLNRKIGSQRRRDRLNGDTSYFELSWKPAGWRRRFRYIVLRKLRR